MGSKVVKSINHKWMKVGTLVLKLIETYLILFFCCIELSVGDRTLTSIDLCESSEMEIIHRASPSTVDLCTPDKESHVEVEEEMMMVDSPVHLSPK